MKLKFWSGQSPDSNFIEKLWNKQNAQKHFSVAKLKQSSIKELNFSTVMWKTGSGTHDLKPWFYIYLGYLSCFASWSETFKSVKYPKTRNQEGDKYFFIHHSFCANEWVRSQNPWNGNKQRNLLNPWMTVWYMLILKCYFRLLDFYFDFKKKHENWNTTLANGGLLCTPDNSCQVLLFWTASQPASYRAKEAGSFITGWRSLLCKWYIGSWQMWVTFSQSDNRHLRIHESDVGGLK